jgi:signal transduction histidine kinase
VITRLPALPGVTVEGPAADGEVTIDGDAEELEKVLYNLCRNGQEAIDGEGRLCLEVAADGAGAVVRVTDTGEGMSPEFVDKELFRPFHTTKKAGLGIGVFQSRAIVEAHGGRMEVASTPGEGTVFTVRLPG